MIVNLDYHDMVYIKKDTLVAYIQEEDISCEYLEVNEIVESTQGINWQPPCNHKILVLIWFILPHRSWSIAGWSSKIMMHQKKPDISLRN